VGGVEVEVEASEKVDFEKARNFKVGDGPHSVAVGDFDRNGVPDLAVANTWDDNVSVLLGKGDGSFGSATSFPVQSGAQAESVAVEDFNGDGIPDLAAANFFSDNVSVLSGKGDGSFGPAINFPVGKTPTSVVARDFNADGIPDLAVANRDSNNVSVLSGKGDGSFGSATNFPLGGGPFSVAVEDFNGDGTPDLAVTNFFSDKVSVSLGKGDGSFGSATNFPVGDRPFSVATEDFNGDGILDMAVANWLDGNVSILINKNPITIIPNITISDTKITEGNIDKTAKFTVTLDNPTNAIVKVNYSTASQTAKVNQDYKITIGTLTFRPGETNKNITVPILGDKRDEPKEKFGLKLSSPQNANIKDGEATGTIVDNDPLPQISIGDAKVTEGNRGQKNMEFEVKLNNPSGKTVRVNYGTQEGSAKSGKDFRNKRGVLTFQPGQTKKIVSIPIFGDRVDENNEQFQVKLSGAENGNFSDNKAVGKIIDNDQVSQISISDAKVVEGNRGQKNMEFEVRLNNPSSQTVKVNYTTVDGNAKSGKDYQKKSGVVTFKPGETKKSINISILGDTFYENTELFEVKLTRAQNAELPADPRKQYGAAIILDNDELPKISIGDAKMTEANRGKKNMEFAVRLNNPSDQTVKVNYASVDGTAKSGKDFQSQKGVVTFKPGETKKTVNIPILGDTLVENTEQFQVKLNGAKNAELSDSQAVGRIQDNDQPPQISISDAKVTEANRGEKNMKFEVTLDNSSAQTVKVNYETINGSAKAGEDFQKKKGVLTFKPGDRKKTVNVPILGDLVDENNEEFQVKLSDAKNGKLSDEKAVGRIIDNDISPKISIGDARVT
ncbi:MAG: FG-GAP-like repeat-containing protein, partial [Trichodesmium sp. St4_bin8_1]|nr:FG-GAP-like repeat-containing protein [Trichodesmium sp. St4_bin8_1]